MTSQEILALLRDADHMRRCQGIKAIGALSRVEEDLISALIACIHDDVIIVRLNVARVLGRHAASPSVMAAIRRRLEELAPDVFFGGMHLRDTLSDAGMEYHEYLDALEEVGLTV